MPTTAAPRKPARPDASEKRKMTFYLTDEERRAYLVARAKAGHTDNSAFIVDALALTAAEASPSDR